MKQKPHSDPGVHHTRHGAQRRKAKREAAEQKAFDEQTERIATNPRSQANVIAAYERNRRKLLG